MEGPSLPILRPTEGVAGRTGDWRTVHPVVDPEKCKYCNICWKYCPDLAISPANREEKKVVEFDLEYCKGCGICENVCPFDAIKMVPEGE